MPVSYDHSTNMLMLLHNIDPFRNIACFMDISASPCAGSDAGRGAAEEPGGDSWELPASHHPSEHLLLTLGTLLILLVNRRINNNHITYTFTLLLAYLTLLLLAPILLLTLLTHPGSH